MENQLNYRVIVEVNEMDKQSGQIDDLNEPFPGTQVIVELDGDDLEHIIYRRLLEFWNREDAEISALRIRQLWNDRFGRKRKITKKAVKQYMFDIDSVIINEVN